MHGQGVVQRNEVLGAEIAADKRSVVRTNQFIVSRIDARNGAFGLVPASLDGAVVSSDFPAFSVDRSLAEPRFLEWLSKTPSFIDLCVAASEGTTNRVRLKEDRFLSMAVPLPPLDEQRRIVARIEELAAKIEEARGLRQEAAANSRALSDMALSQMINPHRDGWTRGTISEVITSLDAGWSPQCLDRPVIDQEWGVLRTTSVQWRRFDVNENKALPSTLAPRPNLEVVAGDVLVTRAGPRQRVGVVACVRESHPHLMISDKLLRVRPDTTKVAPRFLEIALASQFSQAYLFSRKTGLADAQVNISQSILRATPIAFPGLREQLEIVGYIDDVQAKADTLTRLQDASAAELDALLPSVLDRAFKGEL